MDPITDKKVFLNRAEEIAYDRQRERDTTNILPIREEGSWVLPQWMYDIKNAITLPSDVQEGYQPTTEDITNFALTVGVGGFGGAAATGVMNEDALLGTFSGGKPKHFTPLYPEREKPQFGPAKIVPEGWVKGRLGTQDMFYSTDETEVKSGKDLVHDFNFPTSTTTFQSPLFDALDHMDLPAKGKNIIKDLREKAPMIRKSELDAYLTSTNQLDPNKTYSREDLKAVFDDSRLVAYGPAPNEGQRAYTQYQRQQVVDSEIDYQEFPINAAGRHDKTTIPPFKAKNQHYNDDTLAHVRLSLRSPKSDDVVGDASQNYVLVEELQSDLLQHGYLPPPKSIDELKIQLNKTIEDTMEFIDEDLSDGRYNEEDKQFIKNTYLYNLYNSLYHHSDKKFDYLGEEVNKLEDYLKSRFVFNDPRRIKEDYNMRGEHHAYNILLAATGGGPPPITSTTEGVRLGIMQAISYAQQKGVDKIVIPPVDRIIAVRESTGVDFDKNMKPGSAFMATYKNAVNKVLNQLQNELGDKFKIGERELNYRKELPVSRQQDPADLFGHDVVEAVVDANEFVDFRIWFLDNVPDANHYSDEYILATYNEIRESLNNWEPDAPPTQPRNLSNTGLEIDISGMKDLDTTLPRFAKGGEVKNMNKDVPPGATEANVADDIPIMASEGEYVIPANVVNYIGLQKIQKMVDDAKEALGDTSEQVPGGETAEEEDELPFDPSELMSVPHMAEGGVVADHTIFSSPTDPNFNGIKPYKDENGNVTYIPFFNGQPMYAPPPGYSEAPEQATEAPAAQSQTTPMINTQSGGMAKDNSANENDAFVEQNKSPLAGSPNDWSVQDFINFGQQKSDPGTKVIKGMIGMIPGGKLAMAARNKYLDRTSSKLVDQMLETGVDLQGKPIAEAERTQLMDLKTDLIKQMGDQSGLNLNPMDRLGDIFERFANFTSTGSMDRMPASSVSPEAEKMLNANSPQSLSSGQTNTSDNQYSGGGYGMGSDIGRDPDKGPSSGQMASGGLYNKGGLITRRKMKKC